MWPGSCAPELPSNVFTILRDLIHDRLGLHFDDRKRDLLGEKLSPLVAARGFGNFLDYYYLLKYGPDAEAEWPAIINALSVQETYFWREMDQVWAFVHEILPTRVPRGPLRIWRAACATGEEPLTIAMALAEAGRLEGRDVRIFASDASPVAVAKAKRGIYRERSFRALPPELREKYFVAADNEWRVRPELHSLVQWSVANLVNPADVAPLVKTPFIFCRNVFIYFSDATISRAVSLFAAGMERPGYLFVGAAESLMKITDEFELEEAGNAFVYTLS